MKLTGIIPNLITDDIDRALAFYRDVLGFTVTTKVPDAPPFAFAMLERDGINVFLNLAAEVRKDAPDVASFVVGQSGMAMFMQVEGVAAFWEEVKEKVQVAMPLKEQWYGMTEFSICDPDGYAITFAERTA